MTRKEFLGGIVAGTGSALVGGSRTTSAGAYAMVRKAVEKVVAATGETPLVPLWGERIV